MSVYRARTESPPLKMTAFAQDRKIRATGILVKIPVRFHEIATYRFLMRTRRAGHIFWINNSDSGQKNNLTEIYRTAAGHLLKAFTEPSPILEFQHTLSSFAGAHRNVEQLIVPQMCLRIPKKSSTHIAFDQAQPYGFASSQLSRSPYIVGTHEPKEGLSDGKK
jgi:hypothetical protein